jgi:hypothetical protein
MREHLLIGRFLPDESGNYGSMNQAAMKNIPLILPSPQRGRIKKATPHP